MTAPEDVEVRRKSGMLRVRGLVAIAVIFFSAFASLAFYSLINDRSRVLGENRDLREQLDRQGDESVCRSAAAAAQADAQGDLAMATSEAAEYAFTAGKVGDPAAITQHLHDARERVLATTKARNKSIEDCNVSDFASLLPPYVDVPDSMRPCAHTIQWCIPGGD